MGIRSQMLGFGSDVDAMRFADLQQAAASSLQSPEIIFKFIGWSPMVEDPDEADASAEETAEEFARTLTRLGFNPKIQNCMDGVQRIVSVPMNLELNLVVIERERANMTWLANQNFVGFVSWDWHFLEENIAS